jgi:hypothetical protein
VNDRLDTPWASVYDDDGDGGGDDGDVEIESGARQFLDVVSSQNCKGLMVSIRDPGA